MARRKPRWRARMTARGRGGHVPVTSSQAYEESKQGEEDDTTRQGLRRRTRRTTRRTTSWPEVEWGLCR